MYTTELLHVHSTNEKRPSILVCLYLLHRSQCKGFRILHFATMKFKANMILENITDTG